VPLPHSCLLAAALCATAALPARAQLAAAPPLGAATSPAYAAGAPPMVVGPAAAAAPAALHVTPVRMLSADNEQRALQARARRGFSQSQVLMIVGGAAVVTGLIAGGDAKTILVIGGAGVGLYGLYLYLQD
jgi:hypothetical protein